MTSRYFANQKLNFDTVSKGERCFWKSPVFFEFQAHTIFESQGMLISSIFSKN